MNTVRYSWVNTKVNLLMGICSGGEWKKVNFITYWWLRLTNGIVKTETNFDEFWGKELRGSDDE